jgi:hypothetical protein
MPIPCTGSPVIVTVFVKIRLLRARQEIIVTFGRLQNPLAVLRSLRRTLGYASVARPASGLLARPRRDALIS